MPITQLHVVRHGETEWNRQQRMQGHQDSPLSADGILQAQSLADHLQKVPWTTIYSSRSGRAVKTAEILKQDRPIPIILHDAFKEIHLGAWEGLTKEEVETRYPQQYEDFWNRPDHYQSVGGETFRQLQARVVPMIQDMLTHHQGECLLIVTHTAVVKVILAHFEPRTLHDIWQPPYIHPAFHSLIEVNRDGDAKVISYAKQEWPEREEH